MSPQRFEIHVEQDVLDDLQTRLQATRWVALGHEDDWSYGTHTAYLRELVAYWRTSYDWRRQETRLNALPQWKARVLDTNLHFVHAKGRGARTTPLLLLHGWPDSFYRFHKVLPGFVEPDVRGDAFDVVVPSLPGFAFTGDVAMPEIQPNRHTATMLWKLMTEVLGYERFIVAGGDGGSVIAQLLAIDHPDSVIGVHLTDLGWQATKVDPAQLDRAERKYVEHATKAFMADGAYAAVQATRPESVAASLNDSPVGLASWIVDRFHSWSDAGGDLERSFTKDELLTNIMIYWVTQTIGPSMFTYYADQRSPALTPADRVTRPVAMALFPKDIGGVPPRHFAERTLAITRWTEMPRGSHFAALEEPELFVTDVREFASSLRAPVRITQEIRDDRPTV